MRQFDRAQGPVQTSELRTRLPGVSPSLLGNDLNALVEEGHIVRIAHGMYAAAAKHGPVPLLSDSIYISRAVEKVAAKRAVARYVAGTYFRSDGVYGLDAGTTVTMVFVDLLSHRQELSSAIQIVTNNLHGAFLVPVSSRLRMSLVGGLVSHDYAGTCGTIDETDAAALDVAVVGFSRLSHQQGVWTADKAQWPWKRQLCSAKQVVFVGTLDKLGLEFAGEAIHRLQATNYSVVVDADATALSMEERRRVDAERRALERHLVLVDQEGHQVRDLSVRTRRRLADFQRG